MPLQTFGAATSRAFGYTSGGGGAWWIYGSTNTLRPIASVDNSSYLYFSSAGSSNTGLAKFDPNATLSWQKYVPTAGGSARHAVDSAGNIYGAAGGYIYKYDASGTLLWQKSINASGQTTTGSVYVDSSDIPYFAGGTLMSAGYTRGVIVKLTTAGAITWQRYFTQTTVSGDTTQARGAAIDGSGNVYVAYTHFTSSSGAVYGLLAKYNSSGTIQWQRKLAVGVTDGYIGGPALDSAGNVFVSGYGGVAKYNSSGAIQWQRRTSGFNSGANTYNTVVVDATDSPICSNGSGNYVVKWDNSGTIQWQRQFTWVGVTGSNQSLSVNQNFFYLTFSIASTPGEVGKFSIDGTGTGTWSVNSISRTYAASTQTETVGSFTDSAGSATDAAGGLSVTTTTLVEATDTQTWTKVAM